MARKSNIQRELKREKLVNKYSEKRKQIKNEFKSATGFNEKLEIHSKLQKLPTNSSPVRLTNRCWKTGRSKGVFRDFGLCRHMVRDMALQGLIPGLVKSSW